MMSNTELYVRTACPLLFRSPGRGDLKTSQEAQVFVIHQQYFSTEKLHKAQRATKHVEHLYILIPGDAICTAYKDALFSLQLHILLASCSRNSEYIHVISFSNSVVCPRVGIEIASYYDVLT